MNKTNDKSLLLNGGGLCNTPPRDRFNNILIDYWSFTWTFNRPSYEDIQLDLMRILKIKGDEICDSDHKALYGYKSSYKWGLHILFQTGLKLQDNRFSAMLQLSGQAMRDIEKRNVDFLELINYVIMTGGRCTRFDLAYDDFNGDHCDLYKIYEHVSKLQYVSSVDVISYRLDMSKNSKVKKGHSLTFGKSKVILQIYDKKLERLANDFDCWTDFWHRYEIRFKEDIAHTVLHEYKNILKDKENYQTKLINFYFGRLYQILDIKEFSDNVNISEVPTVDFWKSFIGDHSKIKIRSQFKNESTILTKRKWIENSVIKPLTKVALASENEDQYFKELKLMCEDMKSELDQHEILEIEDYKENDDKYIKALSYNDIFKKLMELIRMRDLKLTDDDFFNLFRTLSLSYKYNEITKLNFDKVVSDNIDYYPFVNIVSKIIV